MNVYDKAHELARALKASEEVMDYKRAQERIEGNPSNKKMVEDYRKIQIEMYTLQLQGKQPSSAETERMNRLFGIIGSNSEVREFLEAEMKFSRLMEDIMKILGDASGVDFAKGFK